MHTKLTLRLDEALIASAKDYAAAHGSSVSQIVADYFAALTQKTDLLKPSIETTAPLDDWESKLYPFTRSLLGIARPTDGSPVPTEDDYYAHLEAKHSRHLRDPAP